MTLSQFIRLLGNYKQKLTRRQLTTIRGQAKSGDVEGAMKGLKRLINEGVKK